MDLSLYIKDQKSTLDWGCHLLIGRYCWIRSARLSCLLILGTKDACFFVFSCVVSTDVRISLESLLVVLGLSTC